MLSSSPTVPSVFSGPAVTVELCGVGTAAPDFFATQEQTLDFISNRFTVSDRTRQLYKKTLRNKSIGKRHFAMANHEAVLDDDLDRKNARFEKEAVALSARALRAALADANLAPDAVDFLAVTTCTGYLCPGLSAYVVDACGLRRDARIADLVGMGCGAAIPALEQAHNFLKANPGKVAAVVSTEICSAAMVSNDEIDIVISNTIFADGSAAVILGTRSGSSTGRATPARPVIRGFQSLIVPEWRDTLRFRSQKGHLKNVLGKDVPRQSAVAMKKISGKLADDAGISLGDVDHWILHAGGEKVLDALDAELSLAPGALRASRAVLKNFGNMSSPTVMFVLAEELRAPRPAAGAWGILASFGAGFSAHGALVEWI